MSGSLSPFRSGGRARRAGLVFCAFVYFAGTANAQGSAPTTLLLPSALAFDSAGDLFVADARRNQVFELQLDGTWFVVAGSGAQGYTGDGGQAAAATLSEPRGLVIASDGTVFIADTGNHCVRAISAGIIRTAAGDGIAGDAGDGAAAVNGRLRSPVGLAMQPDGSLLIADATAQRIRGVARSGIITAFAGNGTQGFSGDSGDSRLAQFDTPDALVTAADGTVYIADEGNQRVRAVHSGVVTTIAGSGVRGFGGDRASAISAKLCLPRGLALDAQSNLLIADACNHRVRKVASDGTIQTLIGSGMESVATNGSTALAVSLGEPTGLAIAPGGAVLLADEHAPSVLELAPDNIVYTIMPGAPHAATITIASTNNATYGLASLTTNIAGALPQPQGSMQLTESGIIITTATLTQGTTTLDLSTLPAGNHMLLATYSGDGLHAAASSAVPVNILPAPVTVSISDVAQIYGAPLPTFSGTLRGVLARDAGFVAPQFSSAVQDPAPAGNYPISATLSGSASPNYTLINGASPATLHVTQATPAITLSVPVAAYSTLPITLTANVRAAYRGIPTGQVQFTDGSVIISSIPMNNAQASAVYLNPSPGAHLFTATYSGDSNFIGAASTPASLTVNPMPDFALTASGSTTQSALRGGQASFSLLISPSGGAFSGVVSLAVQGMPAGAIAIFTPPTLIPGSASAPVTLTIQIPVARLRQSTFHNSDLAWIALLLLLPLRRLRSGRAASVGVLLLSVIGCGDRVAPGSTPSAETSYALTVIGTSTDLAGIAVNHGIPLTLKVN